MNLAIPYTRAVLTNRSLWLWGVAFMGLWFVLGAYVFSAGLTDSRADEVTYTAAWFAVIALFSLTTLAMSLATSLTYGTSALSFGFRFSRLTPIGFAASLVVASVAMGLLLSLLMVGLVGGLFSAHFGVALFPADVPALVGISVVSGAFMMGLSTVLVLVVVNYLGLRNVSFVEFVPLGLAYLFGLAQLFVALPAWLLYVSPWNDMESLFFQAYSGHGATTVLTDGSSATLSWILAAAALVAWVALLVGLSAILLRRIRPVAIEEGRQV
jgi:hypothetical protein